MPANFPEIWLERVSQTLENGETADFLDGVEEIDGDATQMGEENLIHVPTTMFSPDILINNTTYPIAVQEYTDSEVILRLDKYNTKATAVTDDQVIGCAYDRIDAVTKAHTNKILTTKFKKALHSIAPNSNKPQTPVLELLGTECTYEDLIALKDKLDQLEWPEENRRLVLCNKHYNQLLKDRKNFGDQLINYRKGEVSPIIAGFDIKKYISSPHYNAGVKKAFGEVPSPTDKPASVVFITDNVKKKTGLTKQYFDLPNTTNQRNMLNYRHYFMALPVEDKFRAVLV